MFLVLEIGLDINNLDDKIFSSESLMSFPGNWLEIPKSTRNVLHYFIPYS